MNWVVPTFHPAHIMRKNRKLEGLLLKDLRRAVGLAQGDWKPKWNEQGDGYKLRPSADDVVRILDSMHGHDVAYDIETDGQHPLLCTIRCIGFWDGKVGVCVPWLFRDGTTEEVVDRDKKGKVKRTKKGAVKYKTVAVWKPYFKGEALKRVNDAIQRLFKRAKSLVSQNGQYDRLCLKVRMGFDIPCALPPHFDTIISHHIVASYMPHGLDLLTSVYTDMPYYKKTEEGEAWSTSSDRELWLYCLRDCEATWLSAQKLRKEIQERPQDIDLYEHDAWQEHQCQLWKEAGIECDEEAMLLFRQHYRGIAAKALKTMKEIVERALAATKDPNQKLTQANSNLSELLIRLEAKADQEETDDLGKTVELFNPASLIQLRALLIGIGIPLVGETDTGQLSTAEEFLFTARKELLAKNVDPKDDRLLFLDCLFAWRAAKKVDSTYLFPELIEHSYTGVNGGKAKRLHPTFAVHVVPSGRLASKKPNFQNQPANIRGMFVARPGHILVYIDWDALEMRLGAFMSGDQTFIEDFKKWDARTGPKVHIVNMCAIFGLKLEKGVEDKYPGCYRAAKVFAYAVAYGAGEQTVFEQVRAEMPDMDFPKFKAVYAAYKQFRKRLFEFQASVVRFATQHQYYETAVSGRRAYFFEQVFGSDSPEASAMQNFPYQGTGSDVVGRANRRIVERVLGPMQKLVKKDISIQWQGETIVIDEVLQQLAQVHDELLFEVPLRLEKEFSEKLKKVAEEPPGKQFTSWSLPVDLKSSRRWKPIKWSCQHCDKALKNKVELELASKTPVLSIWTGKCKTCEKETKVEVVKTPLMDVQPEETPRAEAPRAEEDEEDAVEEVRPVAKRKGRARADHRARNAG